MPYDGLDDDEIQRAIYGDESDPDADLPELQDAQDAAQAQPPATASDQPAAPPQDDRLQRLYQDILSRHGGQGDDDTFKRLQVVSLLGQGLGTLSSALARNQAANYFGGTADPTAVAQARASMMQQANQAGEPIAALANAPVQQYIQRRQQELAAQKEGTQEALNLARAQYYAQGGAKGQQKQYTPEEMKTAHDAAIAAGLPEGLAAAVNPGNLKDILKEQGLNTRKGQDIDQKNKALDQRLEELDRKLADHRTSAAERQRIQAERLEVQKARLNLQGAVQGTRAEADIGQRQVPGVEFEQPLSPQTAKELVRRKGYTAESMRALNELADSVEKVSAMGKIDPRSPEYGKLKALYYSIGPKAIAGEFGNSFTEGHAHVVQQMIENPQGFKGWALTPAIAASARKSANELDQGFRTAVEQAGGTFSNPSNPYATKTPGTTKNYSPAPVRAAVKNAQKTAGTAPAFYATSPDGKQRIPLDANHNPIGPAEPVP